MPKFLFQPDPIDGYEFNPIPIDIHLRIIKIPTEEILDDYAINNTESLMVGIDREVRSAGFEPAIPSLGSSYLNQAGPTSPKIKLTKRY